MKPKTIHTIGGTNLKPRQYQTVQKLYQCGMDTPFAKGTIGLRHNPHTGAKHFLPPLGAVLFDWIVDPRRGDNIAAGKEKIELWHEARYLFRTLWPDEWFDLLD